MRMRKKPWARPELDECVFFVNEPLENRGKWRSKFLLNQPFHVELGCGKGGFVCASGVLHPDVNYLAIDIKDAVLGLAKRKVEEAYAKSGRSVDNVLLTAYEIMLIHEVLSNEDAVDRIYINFCNPWPKNTLNGRRLTHYNQLIKYQTFLKTGGEIWFKTDNDELFDESLLYFDRCNMSIRYITRDLHASGFTENVETEHEKMYMSEGKKIKFVIVVNKKG